MRWTPLAVSVIATFPAVAVAQVVIPDYGSGTIPIVINAPTPTGVNCNNPDDASCIPLNLAACQNTARLATPLQVTVGAPSVAPSGSHLFIWIEKVTSSTTVPLCTKAANTTSQLDIDRYDVADQITVQSWPTNPISLVFPTDFSTTGHDDTVKLGDFMNDFTGSTITDPGNVVTKACGTTGASQVYALCFGVDYRNTGGTLLTPDSAVDYSIEPTAWVRIVVDTVPPEDPTGVAVESLDGRVVVTPTVATTPAAGDLWLARVRPLPVGTTTGTGTDCRTWTDATVKAGTADAVETTAVEVSGLTNGLVYEGCLALKDQVGNPSTGWKSFTATPIDQCDFIECYPSNLKTGYCAGFGVTPLAAIAAALLLRRARKQEVRS